MKEGEECPLNTEMYQHSLGQLKESETMFRDFLKAKIDEMLDLKEVAQEIEQLTGLVLNYDFNINN